MIIRIDNSQASTRLDLWGGTSGVFTGIDRFGRVVDQRWQNNTTSTPSDIDRYQYGYDRDSNRVWKQNTTATGLDEFYAYDALNRLTQMQRGTLNGTKTGITGTPATEQDWGLDPLGNWGTFQTKASGTTNLNQTRTANPANEITGISSTPSWANPPAYDAAGNMTSFPQPATPANAFGAVYDAWNRLVKVTDSSGTVSTYQYDGLGRRITKTTASETRHYYYTNRWQNVEERVGSSTTADVQYVWGLRYVDELICRDDPTNGRLFACQDANFNVTAITDTSGVVQERYNYTPYGVRSIFTPAWASRSSSSFDWVIGHQGLLIDEETQLIYNRFRYLHAVLGRFLARDPILYKDGFNLFQYLNSNPIMRLDPTGTIAPAVIVGLILLPLYVCAEPFALSANATNKWALRDKQKHCWVSCMIARTCSKLVSLLDGIGREVVQDAWASVHGLAAAKAEIMDSLQDEEANLAGIGCAGFECNVGLGMIGRWFRQSCEQCCQAAGKAHGFTGGW